MLRQLFFPEPKATQGPKSIASNNGGSAPGSTNKDLVPSAQRQYQDGHISSSSSSSSSSSTKPTTTTTATAAAATTITPALTLAESTSTSTSTSSTRTRTRKQLSLVLAGATFVTLSTIITRRAVARRFAAAAPPFYSSSPSASITSNAHHAPSRLDAHWQQHNQHQQHQQQQDPIVSGPFEAVEALSIASINVFSWAIFLVGGGLWAFDIQGFAEFRTRMRQGMGIGTVREEMSDEEAEEEIEEWIAGVLARKEDKERVREKGLKKRRIERGGGGEGGHRGKGEG